jgi:hypothetical protein
MKTKLTNWIFAIAILLSMTYCNKNEELTGNNPLAGTSAKQKKVAGATVSAVYGGGPIYINPSVTIPELKASGFTTIVVWTIHIENNGNLGFNGEFPLCQGGSYVGNNTHSDFPANMANLKTASTSVNRIEFGLSGYGSGTFANIKTLIAAEGTGPTSTLYKNFQALKQAVPAVDAINFDDESTYDVASSVQFAVMLADLGYKVTLCPYTSSSYWTSVASQTNTQRAGAVDAIFLQCYDGGAGNSPCNWNFGGIPIYPGLWDTNYTPSGVQTKMASWKTSCNITGGFMWLYDDFVNNGKCAQYASAINTAVGAATAPAAAVVGSPANGATGVSMSTSISWTAGSGATSHDVYFGTTSTPTFKVNQTGTSYNPGSLTANTKYYWRIDEKNANGTTTGTVWSFTTGSGSTTRIDRTDAGGTITARGENSSAGEGKAKAFDNSTSTKWLDFAATTWIRFLFANSAAYACTEYTLTSANDSPERDPKNWTLKGSNNGSSWTTLDTRSNIDFSARFQKQTFTFTNTTAYKYYRFDFTNHSGTITQLAEIEIVQYQ